MPPRKAFRSLSWLALLAAALLTSSCESTSVGVGLGVSAVSPWAPVGMAPYGGWTGGWYGGSVWYP